MKVVLPFNNSHCYFTTIYGKSNFSKHKQLWEFLCIVARTMQDPRILEGDFNAILTSDEKNEGSRLVGKGCKLLYGFLFCNGLKDLGFKGPNFMWSRGHLFKRLD